MSRLLSRCLQDYYFVSSRRRHTRYWRDWSSDVCSSDLFPNLGHSWNIIRLVSHERLQVNELLWRKTHFVHEVRRGKLFKLSNSFFRNLNNRICICQLNQILVTADNSHIKRKLCALCHFIKRSDNIVCLVMF